MARLEPDQKLFSWVKFFWRMRLVQLILGITISTSKLTKRGETRKESELLFFSFKGGWFKAS